MSKEKKCFIIGIGGTGMRCLETFTHMCAMGLYDGMEFNVLTLDTDFTNGNKNRTENNLISDPNKSFCEPRHQRRTTAGCNDSRHHFD